MIQEEKFLDLLNHIEEPNRTQCLAMFRDHQQRFLVSPGSKLKHQAWPGGYVGHLVEIMEIGLVLFESLKTIRPLPFKISDAILVLFLHDLEKPFKYIEPKTEFKNDLEKKAFVHTMIEKYNITITPEQQNALMYIHGEGADHNPHTRIQGPLAAFVHACDNMSARIWFDYPEH